MKIVVWGTGYCADFCIWPESLKIGGDVVAFVDNNVSLKFFKKVPVINAHQIRKRNLMQNNKDHLKASICTYHKKDDFISIKNFMESFGYKTSCSNGYMAYIYGKGFLENFDLRKGILYADPIY